VWQLSEIAGNSTKGVAAVCGLLPTCVSDLLDESCPGRLQIVDCEQNKTGAMCRGGAPCSGSDTFRKGSAGRDESAEILVEVKNPGGTKSQRVKFPCRRFCWRVPVVSW